LLTINQSTRRITGSIQHVADIPLEEIADYTLDEGAPLGNIAETVEVE
jgi:hypothetical protein